MSPRDYEERVAAFFRLLGRTAVTRERIAGVRASHEVDVLVTATRAGLDETWVVECKDWATRRVRKEQILGLQALVADVGADKGFLVAEAGFQPSARRAALGTNVVLTSLVILYLGASRGPQLETGGPPYGPLLAHVARKHGTIEHFQQLTKFGIDDAWTTVLLAESGVKASARELLAYRLAGYEVQIHDHDDAVRTRAPRSPRQVELVMTHPLQMDRSCWGDDDLCRSATWDGEGMRTLVEVASAVAARDRTIILPEVTLTGGSSYPDGLSETSLRVEWLLGRTDQQARRYLYPR